MRHSILIGIIMILSCGLAQAQTNFPSFPQLVNYQGKLTKANGDPLDLGEYILEFNIYENATGGSAVWGPQIFDGSTGVTGHGAKVPVVLGYFNVILGPLDTSSRSIVTAFSGPNRYLGIKVSGGGEISPRQQILSTPYALNGVPAGTIVAFGGNNIPPGWLLCNGAPVSRTKYAALFAAIGTSWGDGTWLGNPATDFNLPDLVGLFLRGKDDPNYARDPDRNSRSPLKPGGNDGPNVGSLQWDATKMPNTTFGTSGAGGHYHTLSSFNNVWRNSSGTSAGIGEWTVGDRPDGPMTTDGVDDHFHSITGGDNETRPKNAYVNWIIKY